MYVTVCSCVSEEPFQTAALAITCLRFVLYNTGVTLASQLAVLGHGSF